MYAAAQDAKFSLNRISRLVSGIFKRQTSGAVNEWGGTNVKKVTSIGRLNQMNPYVDTIKKTGVKGSSYINFYSNSIFRSALGFKSDKPALVAFLGSLVLSYIEKQGGGSFDIQPRTKSWIYAAPGQKKMRQALVNQIQKGLEFTILRYGIKVRKDNESRTYKIDTPFFAFTPQRLEELKMFLLSNVDEITDQQGLQDHAKDAVQGLDLSELSSVAQEDVQANAETAEIEEISLEELPAGDGPAITDLFDDDSWTTTPVPFSYWLNKAVPNVKRAVLQHMEECTTHISVRKVHGVIIFCFQQVINERQSEYLTSLPFLESRPIDVYSLVESQIRSRFGSAGNGIKSAMFTVPLSKIHAETPHHAIDYRGNDEKLGVTQDGVPLFLPKGINKISELEGGLDQILRKKDDELYLDETNGTLAYPISLQQDLIYTDWVNMKFVLVNSEKNIDTMSLDRVVPLTASHARQILERPFLSDEEQFATFVYALRLAESLGLYNQLLPEMSKPDFWYNLTVGLDPDVPPNKVSLRTLFEHRNDQKAVDIQIIWGAFEEVVRRLNSEMTQSFSRFSVRTVLQVLGLVKTVLHYAADFTQTDLEDNTARSAYLDKKLDPAYTPEPVAFVPEKWYFLPHQARVTNAMRNNPKLTILGAQAGAGKTYMAIYHILKRMKAGVGPVLVMCPDKLVPQFIEEFVVMAEGRINCIPLITYVHKRHGLTSLQQRILTSPRNTVVVAGYDCVKMSRTIGYGVTSEPYFFVSNWLRQFNFELVVCDESHKLKKRTSKVGYAVHKLIATIPEKVIMSGTLAANRITDLVQQIALLDPTILGDQTTFIKEFALKYRGTRVLEWKPGAELAIRKRIGEHACMLTVLRKEWAAFLPPKHEHFAEVSLTPAQRQVYRTICSKSIKELQELAATNKGVAKFLTQLGTANDAENDDDEHSLLDEDADDDDSAEEANEVNTNDENYDVEIPDLVKLYLQRLEMFCNAPAEDELGAKALTGADRYSPKIAWAIDRIQTHLAQGIPGKVLVFLNFHQEVEAFYQALKGLAPQLVDRSIRYTAANSVADVATFGQDANKVLMYGISQSLDTGLNLQMASRLIRLSSVWTPGVWEQGNSRVERPNLKEGGKDTRPALYFDTVVAGNTIDVTKATYLMTKIIEAEKFYNAGNPKFDKIKTPPLFTMSWENIFNMNNTVVLKGWVDQFENVKTVIDAEYAEYRKLTGATIPVPIPRGDPIEDSKLMLRVPYAPGLSVYGQKDLGLVRYDKFLNIQVSEAEGEDDEEDFEETARMKGMFAHTEAGDGEITRVYAKSVSVRTRSGYITSSPKLATFVITKAETNNLDVRLQMAKLMGNMPLDADPFLTLEAEKSKKLLKKEAKQKQQEEKEAQKKAAEQVVVINLAVSSFNDYLCLRLDNWDEAKAASRVQSFGFAAIRTFVSIRMKNPLYMLRLFRIWRLAGFTSDEETQNHIKNAYVHFKKGGKGTAFYGFAAKRQWRNFLIQDFKPNTDPTYFEPFPLSFGGELYIGLPYGSGQAGTKHAMRATGKTWTDKATKETVSITAKWELWDGKENLVRFVANKQEALTLLDHMEAAGLSINDLPALRKEISKLREYRAHTKG